MQQTSCDACSQRVPSGHSFAIRGRCLCQPCAQQLVDQCQAAGTPLVAGDVVHNVDPTVCGWCLSDGGDSDLATIASVPTCAACDGRMRNFPFPAWIKVGFVVLLIAAAASFWINSRFLLGRLEWSRALRLAEQGQLEEAATQMEAAARHVPEDAKLRTKAAALREQAKIGRAPQGGPR